MPVYLLHFKQPYKHARHYVGFVRDLSGLNDRIQQHASGRGARLMEVIHDAGISFTVARIWAKGDRMLERRIKKRKETPELCPICNPRTYIARGNYK